MPWYKVFVVDIAVKILAEIIFVRNIIVIKFCRRVRAGSF